MTDNFDWHQDPYLRALSQHLERGLAKFMLKVEATTKRGLSRGQPTRGQPSGRRVGLDPSQPGEYPKVLTGRLRQSIMGRVRRLDAMRIEGVLSVGTEYGRRLELGMQGADRLGRQINQGERPYLRPSVRQELPKLARFLARG